MPRKYAAIEFLSKAIPNPSAQTDYEKYYPQFVDSKTPLSELMDNDLSDWIDADISHPILKDIPDANRVDYFDIPYVEGSTDPHQMLDIHYLKSDKLRPVIIYIHGGGYVSGDKSESRYAGPTLISLGYTLVSINYRLVPQSVHPAQIEDCAMALKWVIDNISNYGGDPNNIAITGHSAGGHLTALLVTGTKWHQKYNIDFSRVKCWIPLSGAYDYNLPENYYHPFMQGFLGGFLGTPDNKTDASPVTYITGNEPPCLIVHGGDDYLAPRTNATELQTKLAQKYVNVELEIIKNYMHCGIVVNYGESGHKPTDITNKFLANHIPVDKKK